MNKLRVIICAALTACLIAVPLLTTSVGVGAESIEEQIAELDRKSAEYQAVLDQTASDISQKEMYAETLLSQINVINEKIVLTRQSMDKLGKDIKSKQGEIDKQNSEIDAQIDALCERLSLIYMAGSASNLEILLGAKDFGDFIDKVSLVKTLSEYDKGVINELNGKITGIEKEMATLESDQKKLTEEENKLKKDIADLNKLVESNKKALSELTAKSNAAQASLANTTAKSSELEAEMAEHLRQEQEAAQNSTMTQEQMDAAKRAAAEAQKAAAQQQQQQDSGDDGDGDGEASGGGSSSGGYSGSGYTWPCPGFYFLSSLWNEDRDTYNHGAIDIAGGDIWGAAVVAADGGTVSDTVTYCTHNYPKAWTENCGCGGGYGNYVKIDHGNGKITIYAHLTSVAVSPGQSVSKGQVIGYVGTTGQSTGAHLHFECRLDNVRYNPMDELSAYWGMVSY